ncbi:hypothetical protein ACWGI8_44330, partial [Streptomyces sp. NPDC054841]
ARFGPVGEGLLADRTAPVLLPLQGGLASTYAPLLAAVLAGTVRTPGVFPLMLDFVPSRTGLPGTGEPVLRGYSGEPIHLLPLVDGPLPEALTRLRAEMAQQGWQPGMAVQLVGEHGAYGHLSPEQTQLAVQPLRIFGEALASDLFVSPTGRWGVQSRQDGSSHLVALDVDGSTAVEWDLLRWSGGALDNPVASIGGALTATTPEITHRFFHQEFSDSAPELHTLVTARSELLPSELLQQLSQAAPLEGVLRVVVEYIPGQGFAVAHQATYSGGPEQLRMLSGDQFGHWVLQNRQQNPDDPYHLQILLVGAEQAGLSEELANQLHLLALTVQTVSYYIVRGPGLQWQFQPGRGGFAALLHGMPTQWASQIPVGYQGVHYVTDGEGLLSAFYDGTAVQTPEPMTELSFPGSVLALRKGFRRAVWEAVARSAAFLVAALEVTPRGRPAMRLTNGLQ